MQGVKITVPGRWGQQIGGIELITGEFHLVCRRLPLGVMAVYAVFRPRQRGVGQQVIVGIVQRGDFRAAPAQ